ncbi:DUF1737 domain-containing protein [Candidatus Marinimicrobia bacterium]|nr:DUF1737 domain-containing protein [Candidatus Neomarinimicrobiota bacterium]
MIGKYKTVYGDDMKELDDEVNDALNRHWKLYGDPYTFDYTIKGDVASFEERTDKVICQALYHPNADHDSDDE